MWFFGLMIGLVLGAAIGGFGGAVVGGFLGWFIGFVFFGKKSVVAIRPAAGPAPAAPDRLSRIEQRLEALERRLASVERAGVVAAAPENATERDANIRAAIAAEAEKLRAGMPPAETPADAGTSPEPMDVGADAATAPPAIGPVPAPRPRPAAEPQPAPAPSEPNFIVRWFTEGNAIVRIGVVILFIGVAFLVKYAADHAMFPLELRLASVAAGGVALLFFGWRLRGSRAGYALTLQGAGVGVLYLTIFATYRLYHLLPAPLAFVLLVGMAILSAMLAVRQDSLALAVAGSTGGFLAPVLASTGTGSHVMLFSYYAVLNLGILAVAWSKAWRVLNLLGFVFTFVIGWLWGERFYRPELFASTEPFLILFFLMYVAIAVLFAQRQVSKASHYVDGTLIFGVPLVAFGLQHALVRDTEYGLALSSLAMGAFYLMLAKILFARNHNSLRLLVESFLALGVVFATLAIPLALDARWTAAAWALEGAGIVWIGVRQQRVLARAFGMALQILAGIAFLFSVDNASGPYPIVNGIAIGALLLVAGGMVTYRQLAANGDKLSAIESGLASFWLVWAIVWWSFGGVHEIDRFIRSEYQVTVAVMFFAVSAWVCSLLRTRRDWVAAEWPVFALLPVFGLLAILASADHEHPFSGYGWLAWPAALLLHYLNLRRQEGEEPRTVLGVLHGGTVLLVAAIGAWEIHWLARDVDLTHSAWSAAALVVVPGLVLLWMAGQRWGERWPLERYPGYIVGGAGVPLVVALWLWSLFVNVTHSGSSAPLPFVPLLNAIDLAHVFAVLTVVRWWQRSQALEMRLLDPLLLRVCAGGAGFIWLNAILLRSIHHWADVPYQAYALWHSTIVQASLSIFWTVLALALMFLATRKVLRVVWIIGAALMAVVVVKLLLIDLSNISGIARIVSFIGVGVLMLVIGYLSPMPPRKED